MEKQEVVRHTAKALRQLGRVFHAEDLEAVFPEYFGGDAKPGNDSDLLDAAKSAVEIIRGSFGDEPGCESDCQAVRILESAIAKAKGK